MNKLGGVLLQIGIVLVGIAAFILVMLVFADIVSWILFDETLAEVISK